MATPGYIEGARVSMTDLAKQLSMVAGELFSIALALRANLATHFSSRLSMPDSCKRRRIPIVPYGPPSFRRLRSSSALNWKVDPANQLTV
jgi:hypothetical protein